jgi:thiol-disulfide isomerase/thioredoxin
MNAMKRALTLLLLAVATPVGVLAAPEHVPAPAAQAALERAKVLEKDKKTDEALAAFYQAVEADPDFLVAHDWLIQFRDHWKLAVYQQEKPANFAARLKEMNQKIDAKYAQWQKRFPDSLGILYGMANQFYDRESPEARPYLLKLAERDPTNAKIYSMLAQDAFRSGDQKDAVEYLHKAAALEPNNPEYAYYYAGSVEPSKRQAAIEDVIARFPNTEAGAKALYWLGEDAPKDAQRIAYFERLRTQFPPEKFQWSAEGMPRLFEAYLRVDPSRAVKLAQDMQAAKASKEWTGRVELAQTFVEVNNKLMVGKANEALALLDKLKPERNSGNTGMVMRLKARVMAAAGQAPGGYRILVQLQAKAPDDETQTALETIGKQLQKSPAQVKADIKAAVNTGAKPAPPFDLQQYTSDDTLSLAKLRGKVVLLTFWFPGCGPCRVEFPHFEAVMQHFHHDKDVAYIGINIIRDQDPYVLPLIDKKGYSFTPLKGTEEITSAEKGFNAGAAPTNFVIDRTGRIVYRDFMIRDAHGELMVQRMIESVL